MTSDLKAYPVMKDTAVPWLGQVPAHWDKRPGRSCYTEKNVPNTGLAQTTVLSLSYGRIVVKPAERLHGLVPESFETYQIVEPGDIIIRPTDLQNDWNSLRFGLSQERGIITSAYLCFRPKPGLTSQYGHLLLHTYDLMKVFYGLGSGLRQNLDWKDFKHLPCLVPPAAEQAAIVHFLDHADRRIRRYISTKQKLIKLLEEQRQAVIHRAVTRGLEPNCSLKPSGVEWLGELPAHWSVLPLRRLMLFVTSGSRGWADYYSDDGDLFVQSGNLGRLMSLDFSYTQHVRAPKGAEGERTRVRPDDILICITGALTGNVVIVDPSLPLPAYVNQHVALVRLRPGSIDPRFLAYALHSELGKVQFKNSEYGGTKQGLGLDDIKSAVVPVPPPDEQRRIRLDLDDRLRVIISAATAAQREIALMREYWTRLVADVVTGKLDVREAAARLPEESGEPVTFDEGEGHAGEEEADDTLEVLPEGAEA